MAKILINLLPSEIIARELKETKFYKIQFIGIGAVLLMIFLASLTLALRILQSHSIAAIQATLAEEGQRVSDLKGTETALALLKNRLSVINQYFGTPSAQSLMYRLIDKLISPSVTINTMGVEKDGNVTILATVPDSASLDDLVNNLTSAETNEGKISQVSIEALNRGRDDFYRITFKVIP